MNRIWLNVRELANELELSLWDVINAAMESGARDFDSGAFCLEGEQIEKFSWLTGKIL